MKRTRIRTARAATEIAADRAAHRARLGSGRLRFELAFELCGAQN